MSRRAVPPPSPGTPYAHAVAAQARLAALVESTPDAIAGVALDGTVTDWNAGAERMFGWAADEIVGRPMSTLVPPERAAEQRSLFERVLRGERIAAYHTVRVAKDGTPVSCSLSVTPLRDAEDRVVAAAAIMRDETEHSEREASERFLLEASARLAQSLDVDSTIRTLAELAVETLADGCRVTLRDEDAEARGEYPFAHVAVTSRVPGRAELAREIQERFPLPPDAPSGFAHVIRTGGSELLPDMPGDPAVLARIASDPEHLALLRALDVRSALIVPIVAGGGRR
jgi:PAS domain S-box-containing protein